MRKPVFWASNQSELQTHTGPYNQSGWLNSISRFCFEGWIWVLNAPVPAYLLLESLDLDSKGIIQFTIYVAKTKALIS